MHTRTPVGTSKILANLNNFLILRSGVPYHLRRRSERLCPHIELQNNKKYHQFPSQGLVTDKIGRRKAMIAVNIPFAAGWFLLYQTKQIWEIYAGFALLGLGKYSGLINFEYENMYFLNLKGSV